LKHLLILVLVWILLLALAGAAIFGMMVLVGLSSTAGDKYGPTAKILGCVGVGLLVPAFKFGMWMARRKRCAPGEGQEGIPRSGV
jgi:hypothetical protein